MTFDELRSHFRIVQRQFEQATTIEEKLRLVALSQEIIKIAHAQIDETKAELAARMILASTLMTASRRK